MGGWLDSRERLLAEIERRRLWMRNTWHQEEMLRLIDQELIRLNQTTFNWAQEAIPQAYLQGARKAWQTIQAAGVKPRPFASFNGINRRAAELLAHNTQDYLRITNSLIARQAKDTVRKVGVEVSSRKFAETLTWKETAKLMQQRLEEEGFAARVPWRDGRGSMRTDSYAELVARTTTAEATNTGTLNQMREMGQVLVKMTEHRSSCKVCASRQGRVYRTIEFPEGDPRQQFPHIREGLPRWPEYKTVHPNCFVSGTPVLAKGVMAHTGRYYVGKVVTVTVSNGNQLTVTPNHPILTSKGWVKAGALLKGDKVIKYTRIDDFLVGENPNDVHVPTLIEDVPHTLREARGVSAYSVEGATEQFHGDGIDGEVTVVNAYSLLRDEGKPFVEKKIPKFNLVNGLKLRLVFLAKRTLPQVFFSTLHPSDSIMRCACTSKSFLWRQSGHHCLGGLGSRFSRWVSSLRKTVADRHVANFEVDCNCVFGHSTFVPADDFVNGQGFAVAPALADNCGAQVAESNPLVTGLALNFGDTDAKDGCNLLDSLSGKVEFLDVAHVQVDSFSGHVYNLHTQSGWYLANGIITHNCAHRLLPYVWTQKTDKEQQAALAASTKPFDLDPRSEKERAQYEAAQRKNAERLRDRKQWERYRDTLGRENVPGFSGFRRMKAAGSENYRFMRLDYLRQNRLKLNPELALPKASKATAADEKFTKYLFNPDNKDGWAKGVAFESRLGYNNSNWQALQKSILQAAPKYPATLRGEDENGASYGQQIILKGLKGRPANVVVGWKTKDGKTWMTTAYIKEVKLNDKD